MVAEPERYTGIEVAEPERYNSVVNYALAHYPSYLIENKRYTSSQIKITSLCRK